MVSKEKRYRIINTQSIHGDLSVLAQSNMGISEYKACYFAAFDQQVSREKKIELKMKDVM